LRTSESGITVEDNAAYTMFSYFIAKIIQKKELNFYIPISKVIKIEKILNYLG